MMSWPSLDSLISSQSNLFEHEFNYREKCVNLYNKNHRTNTFINKTVIVEFLISHEQRFKLCKRFINHAQQRFMFYPSNFFCRLPVWCLRRTCSARHKITQCLKTIDQLVMAILQIFWTVLSIFSVKCSIFKRLTQRQTLYFMIWNFAFLILAG